MKQHEFHEYSDIKLPIIMTQHQAKIIMLLHWSLRTSFHHCYESSIRLINGLENVSLLQLFIRNEA